MVTLILLPAVLYFAFGEFPSIHLKTRQSTSNMKSFATGNNI